MAFGAIAIQLVCRAISVASAVPVSGQGQQTSRDGSSPVPELTLLPAPISGGSRECSQPGCFTRVLSPWPPPPPPGTYLCRSCLPPGKGMDSERLSRSAGVGVGQALLDRLQF